MKCHGQTHAMPLLDQRGKPVRYRRWAEILDLARKEREREFRRKGGLATLLGCAMAVGAIR